MAVTRTKMVGGQGVKPSLSLGGVLELMHEALLPAHLGRVTLVSQPDTLWS